MNTIDKNIILIPKLLREIANGKEAKNNKHDIIFNKAADLIEHLGKIRVIAKTLVEETK